MKAKMCVVLFISMFVFGIPSKADAAGKSSPEPIVGYFTDLICQGVLTGGVSGGVAYVTSKTFFGLATLGKKVFSSLGPRCPLLPFVRR